jgi:hypothetical protein
MSKESHTLGGIEQPIVAAVFGTPDGHTVTYTFYHSPTGHDFG